MFKDQLDSARGFSTLKLLGLSKKTKIKCPFHHDKTPSLQIYQDGSFYCFGCAKRGRNALDFLVLMGTPFKEAVDYLTTSI